MSLWRSPKPVIAQVHGFCVGGGTDFALCSDLIVCAEDCRIGYPPARVWGSPTTAMWMYRIGLERSKRLLLTGDPVDGRTAVEWGLASETVPEPELDAVGARARASASRSSPRNQLHMMKLLVNQAYEQMGLHTTQLIGTLLDGSARHTPEGVGVHAPGDGGPRPHDHRARRARSATTGRRSASPNEVVAVLEHVEHGLVVQRAVERDRVPMTLVQVIAGPDRRIGRAKLRGQLGIALHAHCSAAVT